jgi:flagellar motor switch/type III secretory pathway protein FliN
MSNTSPDRALTTSPSRSDTAPFDVSNDLSHFVGDIEVTITAELGRRLITLHELLRLRVDDVLVFSRPLGEHVDLLAGNVIIGAAEILATEEKLAVRVADLVENSASSHGQNSEPKQTASSFGREG